MPSPKANDRIDLPFIFTALPQVVAEQVVAVWKELRTTFGFEDGYNLPHITYHLAESYHLPYVEALLARIAHETQPFIVRTDGLGIFTGTRPVIHVPVVRSIKLIELQQRLITAVAPYSTGETPGYYATPFWRPHITIARLQDRRELLPEIVNLLAARDFRWQFTIDHLALTYPAKSAITPLRVDFRR